MDRADKSYQMAAQQTLAKLTTSGFHSPIYNQINFHQKFHLVKEKQRMARHCQLAEIAQMMSNKSAESSSTSSSFYHYINIFANKNIFLNLKSNFILIELDKLNLEKSTSIISVHASNLLFLVFSLLTSLFKVIFKQYNKRLIINTRNHFDILIKCKYLKILFALISEVYYF